jgi:hypothetical protein
MSHHIDFDALSQEIPFPLLWGKGFQERRASDLLRRRTCRAVQKMHAR